MYLECAEGKLNPAWRVDKPVSFHRFREKLAIQMLEYDPRKRKYLGDERFRVSTSQHKERRAITRPPLSSSRSTTSASSSSSGAISREDLRAASATRLCGNLTPFCEHIRELKRIPNRNSKVCVVCGKDCYYWACFKCKGPDGRRGVAMHATTREDDPVGSIPCVYHYHNENFFGLGRNDYHFAGFKRKQDWSFPTPGEQQQHRRVIRRLVREEDGPVNLFRTPPLPNNCI